LIVDCYKGSREIANSYVDQQQETKERGDEIAREERGQKSARLTGKNRISIRTGIQLF